jgi:hypothetical protein
MQLLPLRTAAGTERSLGVRISEGDAGMTSGALADDAERGRVYAEKFSAMASGSRPANATKSDLPHDAPPVCASRVAEGSVRASTPVPFPTSAHLQHVEDHPTQAGQAYPGVIVSLFVNMSLRYFVSVPAIQFCLPSATSPMRLPAEVHFSIFSVNSFLKSVL